MTEYTINRYRDGKEIGRVNLTAEQFAEYMAAAQQPEGLIALCDVPGVDSDDTTTVYLD